MLVSHDAWGSSTNCVPKSFHQHVLKLNQSLELDTTLRALPHCPLSHDDP